VENRWTPIHGLTREATSFSPIHRPYYNGYELLLSIHRRRSPSEVPL
jgi:hypothetical protein